MYPHVKEKIQKNALIPKGEGLKIIVEVDADHAYNLETRRSVTGIVLYMNGTLHSWYSKRQYIVETRTYGSELVAARIAVEMNIDTN